MLKVFSYIFRVPKKLVYYWILPRYKRARHAFRKYEANTPLEKAFIQKLARYKIGWDPANKKIVLAQTVYDFELCIKFASASNNLALKHNANIALYSADHDIDESRRLERFLASSRMSTKKDRVFLSFGGRVLYSNTNLYHDQAKIASMHNAIMANIKSKKDVIGITIEGIVIGDLLYDTYLRYADRPQVDIEDPFLHRLLTQALNIFYVTRHKLSRYEIVALVTSYTTYIYHGIVVRQCLQKNIPVYSIASYYALVHKVNPEHPKHLNDHFLFRKYFEQLDAKDQIIEAHRGIFERRFQGEIDSGTLYMKTSAFSKEKNPELEGVDWKNTVVVLAHCFFDSPHVYRSMLFPDFYDWMLFTLEELSKQTSTTVLVKQHPNGMMANDEIFAALKKRYGNTNIKFIDKHTSQMQIINSAPKAIITVHGTAAAEFAYCGIPALTLFDNPFTAYDFTYVAKSVDEYASYLKNIKNLQPKQHKDAIIEYYYMQYYFFLRDRSADYMACAKYKGDTYSEKFLEDYVPRMDEAYFEMMDSAIQDGFKLNEWELAVQNTPQQQHALMK
jgi:hypothetical protein